MKQPFDWLEPRVSPSYAASFAGKHREAIDRELQDRAALLMRLGYSPQEIATRLRAHLSFDGSDDAAARIDAIVDAVEKRRGVTSHGHPPVE